MIDPRAPDYADTPASPQRAAFGFAPAAPDAPPAVSIVTPFFRPGPLFRETARSVLRQSFQQWEWILVNDASPDPESLAILDEFRGGDPRIRVLDHDRNRGLPAARNSGFRAARAEFVYQLDDDDLIEPTAIEKTLWFLVSHPDLGFANGWTVGFDAQRYLWGKGFHHGREFLDENLVTAHAMVRKRVFEDAGGYDESLREGLEDWDFWLRCAARGSWGGTIPEYLSWYRRRENHGDRWRHLDDADGTQAFRERLRRTYPSLYAGGFPEPAPRWPTPFAAVRDELPCRNRLAKDSRRLLLIAPWLTLGGADKFNLDVLEQLTRRDWEVTVATTLAGDHSWAPHFARHTPDLHALHAFLAPVDHPRYLRYLIESRRPDVVLCSNSELGYLLLPYLRARCPEPAYLDYCHMEQEEWKNGGYPRHAVAMQHCLDRNLVSSRHLKEWMTRRGADPEKIRVVHTNVDVERWRRSSADRERFRRAWGVRDQEIVLLFAARLCRQKQPTVLVRALRELAHRGVPFHAVVAGDGEERGALEAFVRAHGLADRVALLGPLTNERVRAVMSASDVFFLPSQWEGIALGFFEAMAMELAIVGADVGGQRELVTPACGVLLPRADPDTEVLRYADALEALARDPVRCRALGRRGRERVASRFRLAQMADELEATFAEACARGERPEPLVRPELAGEWATQAVEYVRLADLAETLWAEREQWRRGDAAASGGHGVPLGAEHELQRIEASRSWRTLQRLSRSPVGRALARLRPADAAAGDVGLSDDPRERLARIEASAPYRLIRTVKRTWPYRIYARQRYGRGWETLAP